LISNKTAGFGNNRVEFTKARPRLTAAENVARVKLPAIFMAWGTTRASLH